MKHLFTLCLLLFLGTCFSQGNLQFNNAYTYSGYQGMDGVSPTWTVPNGKIWKLDFFTHNWLVINNNKAAPSSNNGGVVWLKAGDQVFYSGPFYNICCGGTNTYLISIVEFNIIP